MESEQGVLIPNLLELSRIEVLATAKNDEVNYFPDHAIKFIGEKQWSLSFRVHF